MACHVWSCQSPFPLVLLSVLLPAMDPCFPSTSLSRPVSCPCSGPVHVHSPKQHTSPDKSPFPKSSATSSKVYWYPCQVPSHLSISFHVHLPVYVLFHQFVKSLRKFLHVDILVVLKVRTYFLSILTRSFRWLVASIRNVPKLFQKSFKNLGLSFQVSWVSQNQSVPKKSLVLMSSECVKKFNLCNGP